MKKQWVNCRLSGQPGYHADSTKFKACMQKRTVCRHGLMQKNALADRRFWHLESKISEQNARYTPHHINGSPEEPTTTAVVRAISTELTHFFRENALQNRRRITPAKPRCARGVNRKTTPEANSLCDYFAGKCSNHYSVRHRPYHRVSEHINREGQLKRACAVSAVTPI